MKSKKVLLLEVPCHAKTAPPHSIPWQCFVPNGAFSTKHLGWKCVIIHVCVLVGVNITTMFVKMSYILFCSYTLFLQLSNPTSSNFDMEDHNCHGNSKSNRLNNKVIHYLIF